MRRAVRLPLEALHPYLLELDPVGQASEPADVIQAEKSAPPTVIDWPSIFGNDRPVEIEVGFGKGLFLVNAGSARPDTNFLGIEIERKYTLYVANRLAKRKLGNVRVACGDARAIFQRMPVASVQALHIYFPDPWWKNKHRKRRLFTAEFVSECARILQPTGLLHQVSDVERYFSEITELLGGQNCLQRLPAPSATEPQHDFDYLTNFERKYRLEGRPIHRARYQKL